MVAKNKTSFACANQEIQWIQVSRLNFFLHFSSHLPNYSIIKNFIIIRVFYHKNCCPIFLEIIPFLNYFGRQLQLQLISQIERSFITIQPSPILEEMVSIQISQHELSRIFYSLCLLAHAPISNMSSPILEKILIFQF